ncbi:MAG TPA: hypothetical protein VGW33_03450 [Terriglobia bacterium]|nr:hypothetical protein [Terriglobia bacterium]
MNNKKTTALLSFLMLMVWTLGAPGAPAAVALPAAPRGQAAAGKKAPQWKSREEYDAYQAMAKETDASKKITLAEGVLQKYPTSDFKDLAYIVEMGAYQQLGKSSQAIDAAHKALAANPDNLDALTYLSFAFPFLYKATDVNKDAELTETEANAKHGLEVLQKLQKPANVTDDQFGAYVKPKRAIFNSAAGFVALQKKDYASAITSLKAAIEDNPTDPLEFSLLGQSYLYSTPPDFNNALWNLARAAALAKSSNSPNADALQKFFSQAYENRHGSNVGESDLSTQAAAAAAPPAGFNVAPAEKHKPTGNAFLDAFYGYEDSLKAGGDTADKAWTGLKGQALGGPGWVAGVEKADSGYTVHVNITSAAAAKDGAYDIELKDSSQPDCKDLLKGDPVSVQGTISAYTATPTFVLTLDNGKIDQATLAMAAARAEAERKKNEPKHRTHRTDQPGG